MIDFLIAGFPKCGTTTLNDMLKQHPRICMHNQKESHFFSHAEISELNKGPGDERLQKNLIKSLPEYLDGLDMINNSIKGESSVFYVLFDTAFENAKQYNSSLKVVLLTRLPSKRILSNYKYLKQRKRESFSLKESIELEQERKRNQWEPIWRYKELSNYKNHLLRISTIIDKGNIRLIDSDDFFNKPEAILRELEMFLGVEEYCNYQMKWEKNSKVPPPYLHGLTRAKSLLGKKSKEYIKSILYRDEVIVDKPSVIFDLDADYRDFLKEYEDYYITGYK